MGSFDGHEAPTSLGSIYGYRYWYLVDGRLVSVTATTGYGHKVAWSDGENVAKCNALRSYDVTVIGVKPVIPVKPEILSQERSGPGAYFGNFVNQARVSPRGGFSFPTTETGAIIIPHYQTVRDLDFDRRKAEAQEHYDAAMRDYEAKLADWESRQQAAAEDMAANHQVPVLGCRCGFYMVKQPKHAHTYTNANAKDPLIFGVVEGYGKVVVGDHGWRFEKARIAGLVMNIEFLRSRMELTLTRSNRVELMPRTIEAYNDFSAAYSSAEFYKNDKALREEWDERVKNS